MTQSRPLALTSKSLASDSKDIEMEKLYDTEPSSLCVVAVSVVKFNKNDDQWDNYPHMYKQSSNCTCFIKNQFPTHSSHCFYSPAATSCGFDDLEGESWDRWWQIQHRTRERSKQGQMPIRRGWEPLLWVNLSLTGFQPRGANTSKKCWQGSLFRKWRVWWGPGRMKDMCLVVIVSIYDCIVLIPSSGLQCIIFTCQYSGRPDMSSHGKQTGPGQDTLHLPPSTLQEMDNHHQELGWFYFNTPQCWWKITLWIFVTFMIYFLEVSTTPICLE